MTRLRVGIIGAGANTRLRHLPGLLAIAEVELAAVCNRSPSTARKVAAEFGIRRTEDDWRKVVEDPKIDAIVIGTWPDLHAKITLGALAAGKHVLTEARMAASLAEAEEMLAASRSHPELVAQIVPAPLSLDFDATIAGMVMEGALGRLREVCITHTAPTYADEAKPMTWRLDESRKRNQLPEPGIDYETVRRWPGVDPHALAADAAVFTPERVYDSGAKAVVRVPESLTVLARYREGFRLVAHFSGVERGLPRNEVRLNGSSASLRLDLIEGRLWLARGENAEVPVDVPEGLRRGWRVEEDFVASIRTRAPVRLTDFASGVAYMRFTEAVRRQRREFPIPCDRAR